MRPATALQRCHLAGKAVSICSQGHGRVWLRGVLPSADTMRLRARSTRLSTCDRALGSRTLRAGNSDPEEPAGGTPGAPINSTCKLLSCSRSGSASVNRGRVRDVSGGPPPETHSGPTSSRNRRLDRHARAARGSHPISALANPRHRRGRPDRGRDLGRRAPLLLPGRVHRRPGHRSTCPVEVTPVKAVPRPHCGHLTTPVRWPPARARQPRRCRPLGPIRESEAHPGGCSARARG